jgi:hypothetical protein
MLVLDQSSLSQYNVYVMYNGRHWKEHVNIFVSKISVNRVTIIFFKHIASLLYIIKLFIILQKFLFKLWPAYLLLASQVPPLIIISWVIFMTMQFFAGSKNTQVKVLIKTKVQCWSQSTTDSDKAGVQR